MRRETLLLQATVCNYVYYTNDFSFELFRAIFPAIYFRRFSTVLPRTMSEVDFGQFLVASEDVGTFAKEIGKCSSLGLQPGDKAALLEVKPMQFFAESLARENASILII